MVKDQVFPTKTGASKGIPSQHNKVRKGNKSHPYQKEVKWSLFVDHLCIKSHGNYKNAIRTNNFNKGAG